MQEFLDLFDSEESVERDYLKNILHKLYAKVSNFSSSKETDARYVIRGISACSIQLSSGLESALN